MCNFRTHLVDFAWLLATLLVQAFLAVVVLCIAPIVHLFSLRPAPSAQRPVDLNAPGPSTSPPPSSSAPARDSYLVTGASAGIGAALALRLAATARKKGGADASAPTRTLYLIGRSLRRLDDTRRACVQCGGPSVRVVSLEADVQDRAAMRRVVLQADAAERDAGCIGLSCVVANAGITTGSHNPEKTAGFSVAVDVFNINLMGTMYTIEPVVDLFASRRHGQIVIMSSVSSFFPSSATFTSYASSKVAQRFLGEALRVCMERYGVDVLTVCPGFVDTVMTRDVPGAVPRMSPDQMAAEIQDKMMKRGYGYLVFPRVWHIIGHMWSLLPYSSRYMVSRACFPALGGEAFHRPKSKNI